MTSKQKYGLILAFRTLGLLSCVLLLFIQAKLKINSKKYLRMKKWRCRQHRKPPYSKKWEGTCPLCLRASAVYADDWMFWRANEDGFFTTVARPPALRHYEHNKPLRFEPI